MIARLRRREFITLLGAAASCPPTARAQQASKLPTIGFMGSETSSVSAARVTAFVQRLRELGWIENRTVTIEYRFGEGRAERYAEIAAEFIRLKVDIIVTSSTAAVMAAKQATAVIPIVFAQSADPIGSGLVVRLARPGGNVTGLTNQQPDTDRKRLALLHEAVPDLSRVAFMGNIDNAFVLKEMREVQAAASMLGLEFTAVEIRRAQDIAPALDALRQRDGLYLAGEALTDRNRLRINILAIAKRMPTIWTEQECAEAGGLMSYGSNFSAQFRRAGELVDKILRGAKAGDIPVEQPVKFVLVINLIVAKALGLEVPQALVTRADEVIE
jgi:putative tryptophan/tyrosine transport system substrate-binding protein